MRGTTDQQIESLVALTPKDLVPREREGVGALGLGAAIAARKPKPASAFAIRAVICEGSYKPY